MRQWFYSKWKQYNKLIFRILAFAIAILISAFFLPKSGQFKYEYEKGRPWRHANLIAPFDFPIYKSLPELKTERDSLLKHFRPYYTRDSTISDHIRQQIATLIPAKSTSLRQDYPMFFRSSDDHQAEITAIERAIYTELQTIYAAGIIELSEEHRNMPKDRFELMLIRGNIAEPYGLSELYTAKQAYETLIARVLKEFDYFSVSRSQKLYNLLSGLELNKIIVPDIAYNAERTEQERQNTLRNLSFTTGKVITDQRIIGTGDIVDDHTDKIIQSLKREYEVRLGASSGISAILVGQLLILSILLSSIFLFLYFFRNDVYQNIRYISFILMMMLLMIIVGSVTARAMPSAYYIIPVTILPIILRTFFDSRLAFYVHVITVLILSFHANNSFQFAILHIPAGMVAIFTLLRMVRRSQIVRSMLFILLTYTLLQAGLTLWQEGNFTSFQFNPYGQFMMNGLLILLSYPLIYILEKTFGFVSDVTLLELSDTNHPLLRQMAEKTPGTFQHSIQVGNLAQEVAHKIGGNPMLVRAGAMYHDIGKMASPMFFTENQINNINPHSEMGFEESAQIIISHIENGIRLAHKNKLPQQIIDFIATHQGTTKARYFFNSYVNSHPGTKPDESKFTYPGPTPFTKETAILMMSDAVEASSRSLKNFSDKDIDDLVERIINIQIEERQFDNAPITFREIKESKEVFKKKLKSIYHARIEYPKLKEK